jgi:hypothetical protein
MSLQWAPQVSKKQGSPVVSYPHKTKETLLQGVTLSHGKREP